MSNTCSPSRLAAFKMLLDYTKKGIWSDKLLEKGTHMKNLDKRDRALCVNIFTGVIQNEYYLDYLLNYLSNREIDKIDLNALIILRMGLYQIFFLTRVPVSASVNESVNLCGVFCTGAKSFVNAVLRKATSSEPECLPADFESFQRYLSVRYSCSEWFSSYLINRYGNMTAESILSSSVCAPDVCIQVNTCRISTSEFQVLLDKSGIEYKQSELLDGSFHISGLRINSIPGYDDGLFYVQDDSSRFCSIVAACNSNDKILDCCASPGGKSFAAAVYTSDSARIVSCDINDKKVSLIQEGAERLKFNSIQSAVKDAKVYDRCFDSAFDCVFCDAPCSGMGVIRKKPEIKYKKYDEISRLPNIQKDILNNVSKYVKPNGKLIYSTCTILKEENEDVVDAFLTEGNFKTVDFSFGNIKSSGGMYTFLPGSLGTDGFFIASLVRIS